MSDVPRNKPPDPFALVSKLKSRSPAPVHLWNPPFCGDIDMRILRDGSWLHEGMPIRRQTMVQLFASILVREADNQFYLVTPAEKVRIQVEDCPFVIVLMDVLENDTVTNAAQQIRFTTNTDESITLDSEHGLMVTEQVATGEPHPIVHVRSGLNALISRSVFYQLVALAEQRQIDGDSVFGVWSCGVFFPLGSIK